MLDATLVAARHAPPAPAADLGAKHPKEPEADWTRKGGKAHFGYKAHVGVDAGSGLVRSVEFTSAKVNDGEVADGLIVGRAMPSLRLHRTGAPSHRPSAAWSAATI